MFQPRRVTAALLPLCLASTGLTQVVHEETAVPPNRTTTTKRGGPPTVPQTTVRRGPFVSIQVNIDRNGSNVRGDAANEPSIAIDPRDPKRIAIGWRQFDTINSNFRENGWAWSKDGGKTWTSPGVIQNGLFNSDPVLDTDASGNFYYLSYPGGRICRLFRSTNGAQSWTGPTTTAGGDKPWLVVDKTGSPGRGHVYVIWQVAHGPNTFIRSTNGGTSFSAPVAVPATPTFGTMAVAPNGDLYCCGLVRQNFGSFVLAKSTNAKLANQTPTFTTTGVNMGGRMVFRGTPNPAGLMGQAQVAVDASNPSNVYLLCSVASGSDPMDVHIVKSTNAGASFGTPVRVNDDSRTNGAWQWFGTLAVAPNGRIDVVWNDTRGGSASVSETYYAYSLNGATSFSKNVPVSPGWNSRIGWPRQNKIGDYYHMVSDDAEAHLAYAATFNGEQDVYYLELGDCNENGVHDGVDIARGTSFDSNKNTIPDECEFCQKDLGSGAGTLLLRVCGDDLTQAQSRATIEVRGGPAASAVVLALSLHRLNPPLPLPWGGALVPDLFGAPSVLFVAGATNGNGQLGLVHGGGPANVATIYAQAFMARGASILVSNAVEMKTGS